MLASTELLDSENLLKEPASSLYPNISEAAIHKTTLLEGVLLRLSAAGLQQWNNLTLGQQLESVNQVTTRFADRFREQVNGCDGIAELELRTAGNLHDAISLTNTEHQQTNTLTLSDADGVFINQWLEFQRFMKDINEMGLLSSKETYDIKNIMQMFTSQFPGFVENIFDLEGLSYLHEQLSPNNIAMVVTDRFERFLGFNWFQTPGLVNFFNKYLPKIKVFTNMKRSKGGNNKKLPQVENYIFKLIEEAYNDGNQNNLVIQLISDVKSMQSVDVPPTNHADETGNEGIFLAQVVKAVRTFLDENNLSHITIIPRYNAINSILNFLPQENNI